MTGSAKSGSDRWLRGGSSADAPVILAPCPSYEEELVREAVRQCVEGMGGLDWVKAGMRIAVKVNLVAGLAPERAGTTNPAVVRQLVRLLTQRGAKVTVGDSPGGTFTERNVSAVYQKCHMEEALSPGGELNRDFSVREAFFPEAVSLKTFSYTGWLDEADAIINVCKFKTHAMMAMSCAVKNLFGVIPGTMKPEYHMRFPRTESFAHLMVDLNEYFHPVFHIVDAVVGMEGNGPTAGRPRQVGLLLASRNPYCLDLICAALMGLGRGDVPTIQAAWTRGLGMAEAQQVTVNRDWRKYVLKDYQLVTRHRSVTFGGGVLGPLISTVGRWALDARPQAEKARCIGCGRCERICPAGAITMEKGLPSIDRRACIRCFCCQEFCPEGAMKVIHNPVGRLTAAVNREKKGEKHV